MTSLDDMTAIEASIDLTMPRTAFAAPDITAADLAAVERVLTSGWLTTGDECLALEADLSDYLGGSHVVAVSSCTAALEIALAYADLRPGARVGVPTWTFVSSALAAVHRGALPVLLDVDPDTLNLSPAAVEEAIDVGLDALVAVHFGGVPVAREIHEMCAAAGVPIIEDAAHAFGATDHRGRLAGQGTAGACFSFYATKNLTSGEGGALATDDADLAAFARSFRLHGLSADAWARYGPDGRPHYDLLGPGLKANLPDILAALARSQLARFDALQARRRLLVDRYRENLRLIDGLRCVPGEASEGSADHLMVAVLPAHVDRERVIACLASAGIGTSVHFQPLHTFDWFRDHAVTGPSELRVANDLASRVLSLPLHPGLSDGDVDRVCEMLSWAIYP